MTVCPVCGCSLVVTLSESDPHQRAALLNALDPDANGRRKAVTEEQALADRIEAERYGSKA